MQKLSSSSGVYFHANQMGMIIPHRLTSITSELPSAWGTGVINVGPQLYLVPRVLISLIRGISNRRGERIENMLICINK